jgi:hypothetical protein
MGQKGGKDNRDWVYTLAGAAEQNVNFPKTADGRRDRCLTRAQHSKSSHREMASAHCATPKPNVTRKLSPPDIQRHRFEALSPSIFGVDSNLLEKRLELDGPPIMIILVRVRSLDSHHDIVTMGQKFSRE